MAANGIYDGVTEQDIISDTLTKQQMDEALLRYNADTRSYETNTAGNYNSWAKNQDAQNYRYQGKLAKSTGAKNAFATLLGNASSAASMGAKLK